MIPLVSLTGVRVTYLDAEVLEIATLHANAGEVLAVIGPNGSGKSTLLRVIALLQAPTAGEIAFRGERVGATRALAARRRMAMVFQQPLLADMTVADNVALGLGFRGVHAADARAPIERWLGRLGVAGLASRQARTLSGGEAQRVALARALVLEPELLLLDEPFAALDEPSRTRLIADLGDILRVDRVTTILVTHDRGEARALADRVAVLIQGRIHQIGTTADVFQTPVSEEVARFVGVETIVTGEVITVEGGVALIDVAGRKVEVAASTRPGERIRIGIRPEDVTLTAASGTLSSARNHLSGTILRVTPGSPVRVVVDCGFPLVAAVTPRSVAELGLEVGRPITAVFKASAPHLIRHD